MECGISGEICISLIAALCPRSQMSIHVTLDEVKDVEIDQVGEHSSLIKRRTILLHIVAVVLVRFPVGFTCTAGSAQKRE